MKNKWMVQILIFYMHFLLVCGTGVEYYTNQWLVHVPLGKEVAKVVAQSNDMRYERPIYAPISDDAKPVGDTFTSSRLVWPEQLPDGDRIREQMFYIPEGYKYEMAPMKRILIQTGMGEDWERVKLDQGEFIGCAVNRCSLTLDKSLGPEVDAVLFRHNFTKVEFKRPPNQIWIILFTEGPFHSPPIITEAANVFNWTVTYRRDSDIPIFYGYFMVNKPPLPREHIDIPRTKTKKVAWFVSNCKADNNREEYAKELAKHIDVDIYGKCGTLQCPTSNKSECYKMLEKDYKFYLSFENSNCRHYITEKFFVNALKNYVVPIVMGPSRKDYEMMAPEHSFIHVDDFASPEQLAAYLHVLDQDDTLYEEYFQWQNTGTVITGLLSKQFFCRLCAMLHDENRPTKHYEDINAWWRGDGICYPKPPQLIPPNNT